MNSNIETDAWFQYHHWSWNSNLWQQLNAEIARRNRHESTHDCATSYWWSMIKLKVQRLNNILKRSNLYINISKKQSKKT
jgi:hypothetical protein